MLHLLAILAILAGLPAIATAKPTIDTLQEPSPATPGEPEGPEEEPNASENTDAANAPTVPSGSNDGDASSEPTDRQATEAVSRIGSLGLAAAIGLATVVTGGIVVNRKCETDDGAQAPSEETRSDRDPVEHPGPEGALLMGRRALDDGDVESAKDWFDTALALDPSLNVAAFCRGVCLRETGDLEEAAASFREAIEIQPDSGRARYHLAATHAELGNVPKSVETLRPLVAAEPNVADQALEDSSFAALRDDPRFLALVDDLG